MLGGRGFMLARQQGRRSWHRHGSADTAARRSPDDTKYGNLDDQLDHPEVWNDWSGGYGDAYRQPGRLNTYHWASDFDARWPGQLVHAQKPLLLRDVSFFALDATLASNADFFIDSPGSFYPGYFPVVIGKAYIQTAVPITATGGVIMGPATIDAQSYGARPALFGSYLMIPITDGSLYRAVQLSDYAIYNAHEDYPHPGRAFTTAGNRLWRAHGPGNRGTYLQSCAAGADPTVTSNWSATLNVGDVVSDITDLAALGDQVFAGGGAGLYAGDQSGTFYNILSEVASQRHPDNCRDLAIYNGQIHAQTIGGVYAVQPAQNAVARALVRDVGPSQQSDRSPIQGYVRALRQHGPWLYAGLWTGSRSHLLAGIDASPGLPYVWHTMQRLPHTARIHRIHVDGASVASGSTIPVPNRMWVATDASIVTSGTAPIYLWPIPAQNGNPLAPDPAFIPNYNGSARMDFPATNWQAPATPKVMRSLEVWADNLAASVSWGDWYYTVDSGASVFLGSTYTSPKTTLYFPTEAAGGSFVMGQSIALTLQSFTMSAGITPVYRSVVLHGALRPGQVDQIDAVVRVSDGMRDRRGGEMRNGATMLAELRAMRGPAGPQPLADLTGAGWYVNVLAVDETESWQQGQEAPEIAAAITMAVMSFSGGSP